LVEENALGHAELMRYGALPHRASDAPVLVADSRRLIEEVGFTPSVTLADGIARTIAHWCQVRAGHAQTI
jgi:nucleoside-diphosphate-sugar epimerase